MQTIKSLKKGRLRSKLTQTKKRCLGLGFLGLNTVLLQMQLKEEIVVSGVSAKHANYQIPQISQLKVQTDLD